jgi:AcrR family transcriptional regulator
MTTKKRKTREQRIDEIMAAAMKVFVKKGYSNTTMEDIIAETELSKGGFYHYYTSTKEILIEMMARGNMQYMLHNEQMQNLNPDLSADQKVELLLEAFVNKSIQVTNEKKIYSMFLFEAMYDKELWDAFIGYERIFMTYVFDKMGLDMPKDLEEFYLMSRMLSALLVGQQTSHEPELMQRNKEKLKDLFRSMVLRAIS